MGKIVKLTESDLVRIVKRVIKEQTAPTGGKEQKNCPDPKNPNSYPGVRQIKGYQGLLNKLNNAGLVVDGKYGPKTSEALKKYITSKGLSPVMNSKGLVDSTFGGNKELYDKLSNFLIQDGLKSYVPPVPEGCQKFKFDN